MEKDENFGELLEKAKILDFVDDLFGISDPSGKVIFLNEKARNEFSVNELSEGEHFCYNYFNCTHLESIPKFCPANQILKEPNPHSNFYQMNTKIGEKYFILNCTPIYNGSNKLKYILHFAKDVTENVLKEKKLIHFNQILKSIRNLNQFLYLERDAEKILDQSCKILTETMDYLFAAILITSPEITSKKIFYASQDKVNLEFEPNEDSLRIFLEQEGKKRLVRFQELPKIKQKFSQFFEVFDGVKYFGIILPIAHRKENFGYLLIFSKWSEQFSTEEINLLRELADDILLSLYTIKTEREKEQIEKEIREKERFYFTLLSNLPGFVYRCKKDRYWTMEYLSDNFYKITGYKPEEVIGNKVLSFNDLIHRDHQERLWVKWQIILSKHEVFQDEYPIITKSGEIRWVFEQGCGIYDEKGKVIALEGYIVDITDRKKIEEQLKESERKYRTLFEASSDAIFLMAADSFIDCNFATLKMFECERKDIIGRAPYEFSPQYQPDGQLSRKKAINYIERAYRGEELRFEWVHKTLNGREFECEVTLNKIQIGKKVNLLAIVRDISERKPQYNEILKLAQALNSIGEAVIITDLNNNIIYVNKAFENLYGYALEEVQGKHISIIRTKDYLNNKIDEEILSNIANKTTWRGELQNRSKDGRNFWVSVTASPILGPDGNVVAAVGVAVDLTERHNWEKSLKESEEQFRTLVNSMDDIVYTLDTSHRQIGLYGRWVQNWGLKVEDFLGKTALEIFGAEEGKIHIEMQEKCLKGESLLYEWSKTLGGETYYFQTRISPLRDESGNIVGIVGIGRDITSLKKLELHLKKLLMAIEQVPVGVFVADLNGKIMFFNPAMEIFLNCNKSDCLGKHIVDIHKKLLGEKYFENYDAIWDKLKAGERWTNEINFKTKDGLEKWFRVIVYPLIENEKIFSFIGLKDDITEEKIYIQQLKEAKEKSEELNAFKNYLLMNFSHEFRTLLNGILGWSYVLMDEEYDPEIREIGGIIYQSGSRLLYTVSSIIDYSKIETGFLKPLPREFDIVDTVREFVELHKKFNPDKPVEVSFNSDFETYIVYLDEYMVRSIVSSLISNAFKFTREGKIDVKVKIEQKEKEEYAKIIVSDTGIGIPSDKIDLIWKEFYQVSQGVSREFEGQGLGLTIAKKFTEILGGNISVASELNRGSTFVVELPVRFNSNK